MSFKQLWAYYSPEEAAESAKVLAEAGIECRISQREKGLLGDPATSDLIWLTVAESDYQRATEVLGVTNESTQDGGSYHYQPVGSMADEDQGLMMKCPLCKSLNVKYDNESFKTHWGRLFTMPWSKRRFFCEDCKHIWDRSPAA